MAHREDIRAYLEGLTIRGNSIDWGCGAKPVKNYLKAYDNMTTIDNNPNTDPDHLHDITQPISLPLADHAFCMEVLEHVEHPDNVIKNIFNNLKPRGVLHLSVPFLYPEHGEQDYWRFTKQGLILIAMRNGFMLPTIIEITDGYIMEAVK